MADKAKVFIDLSEYNSLLDLRDKVKGGKVYSLSRDGQCILEYEGKDDFIIGLKNEFNETVRKLNEENQLLRASKAFLVQYKEDASFWKSRCLEYRYMLSTCKELIVALRQDIPLTPRWMTSLLKFIFPNTLRTNKIYDEIEFMLNTKLTEQK